MDKENFSEYKRSFMQIITKMKEINQETFNLDKTKNKFDNLLLDLENLYDEYNNTYIALMLDNNDLYTQYTDITNQYEEEKNQKIKELNETAIAKKKALEQELLKKNSDIIAQYKKIDSQYIPKVKSINQSKVSNKQEYINKIQVLNKSKVNNKRNYDKVADEFTYKAEMNNKRINKIINHYDKKYADTTNNVSEILSEAIEKIDAEYKDLIETVNKKIAEHEKEIMTSTAKLNEDITELSKSYDTRKKYGFIPYNLEENQQREQQEQTSKEYQFIENSILEEFKLRLQENDEKLEELKLNHKKHEDEYNMKVNHTKTQYNVNVRKTTLKYDKEIATLYKEYTKTNDKKILIQYKLKINEKKKIINELKKEHLKELKAFKKEYIEFETDYIEKVENLRVQKLNFESTKSAATKNLNSEIESSNQINSDKLSYLSKRKEFFVDLENVDESKIVYKMRLNQDINEASINSEIKFLERDIRELNYQKKYNIERETLTTNLKKDILKADLKYQNTNMVRTIEYNQVIGMLEIEKNRVLQNYNSSVISIKEEQALNTLNYLNKCDNIQYDIYKIESSLETKKLDCELNYNKDCYQNTCDIIDVELKGDLAIATSTCALKEGLANADLYKKRFSNESSILAEIFKLYKSSILLCHNIEKYFMDIFNDFNDFDFYEFNTPMMELMDLIKNLKQDLTEDFYTSQSNVINTRLSFQKDVKFSKQYDIISLNEKQALEGIIASKNKIEETINNYRNTIAIFKNKLNDLDLKMKDLNQTMKKSRNVDINLFNESRKEYILCAESKRRYQIMIEENKKSINELNYKKHDVDIEIKNRQTSFKNKFERIRINQTSEAKVYYDALEALQTKYNEIKKYLFVVRKKYDFYHIGYENLKAMCIKLEGENLNFERLMTNKYNSFSTNFIENVLEQDIEKENHVKLINSNEVKSIMKDTSDKVLELNNKAIVDERRYHNDILIINDQITSRKEAKLHEIKELTENELDDNYNYRDMIADKREELSLILDSISSNILHYERDFNKESSRLSLENRQTHDNLEYTYRENINKLNQKRHRYLVADKNQRQNIRQMNKNAIVDLNNEYKKNIIKSNNTISTIKHEERRLSTEVERNKKNSMTNLTYVLKTNRNEYDTSIQNNLKYSIKRKEKQIKELKARAK